MKFASFFVAAVIGLVENSESVDINMVNLGKSLI